MLSFSAEPRCIAWLPGKANHTTLAYSSARGPIYLWEIEKKGVVPFEHTNGFDHELTLFRWHHTDPTKFVVGHVDGSLSIFFSGKMTLHASYLQSTPTFLNYPLYFYNTFLKD